MRQENYSLLTVCSSVCADADTPACQNCSFHAGAIGRKARDYCIKVPEFF